MDYEDWNRPQSDIPAASMDVLDAATSAIPETKKRRPEGHAG